MPRRWSSFHTPTTIKEALGIPKEDRSLLFQAMASYRDDLGVGYRVENYGDGLWMITDSGRGQGRCVFFRRIIETDGTECLVALLFYKKETRKVPERILKTARRRFGQAENDL